mmetsp:Transcript_67143/g.194134  ORF Transcript_67143/g.194134 Transcript_67143/m.194134 type:complete len:301 (-) Transcript_67143:906-1808(-)
MQLRPNSCRCMERQAASRPSGCTPAMEGARAASGRSPVASSPACRSRRTRSRRHRGRALLDRRHMPSTPACPWLARATPAVFSPPCRNPCPRSGSAPAIRRFRRRCRCTQGLPQAAAAASGAIGEASSPPCRSRSRASRGVRWRRRRHRCRWPRRSSGRAVSLSRHPPCQATAAASPTPTYSTRRPPTTAAGSRWMALPPCLTVPTTWASPAARTASWAAPATWRLTFPQLRRRRRSWATPWRRPRAAEQVNPAAKGLVPTRRLHRSRSARSRGSRCAKTAQDPSASPSRTSRRSTAGAS